MIIEKIVEFPLRLFVTGNYDENQPKGPYEEIKNIRIHLDDTDITETLSFSQLFDIEAEVIKSIRGASNIQKS